MYVCMYVCICMYPFQMGGKASSVWIVIVQYSKNVPAAPPPLLTIKDAAAPRWLILFFPFSKVEVWGVDSFRFLLFPAFFWSSRCYFGDSRGGGPPQNPVRSLALLLNVAQF
jgi:hypothetical protein